MISKADHGNSVVITYQDEYKKKVLNFISNNSFTVASNDLTKEFQRDLRNNINECQSYKKTKDGNTLILTLSLQRSDA
jgi:hypothetical protein